MENRNHFILSNRQVYRAFDKYYLQVESRIDPALPLHYAPYFFREEGLTENTIMKDPVQPVNDDFIKAVVQQAEQLQDPYRNVTIYIHGFHHLMQFSYKLDVMADMVNAYCNPADRIVGKFIFFSWPATQFRRFMDDRAHAQGLFLYRNNKALFRELYAELSKRGIKLNLMAHSFGHRLLNGFLAEAQQEKLFDKVFLFAADIPHECMSTTGPGIELENWYDDLSDVYTPEDKVKRRYNLTPLASVAGETYCYYCRYDRLLLASTDGELDNSKEDNHELVDNFLCLGTMGNANLSVPANVKFQHVLDLFGNESPLKQVIDGHPDVKQEIDSVLNSNEIHSNLRNFSILKFTRDPWVKVHRYLSTSTEVVNDVKKKFSDPALQAPSHMA